MTIGAASALAVVFVLAVAGKATASRFAEFRRSVGRLWPGPERLSPPAEHALAVGALAAEAAVATALALGVVAAVFLPLLEVPLVPAFGGAALLLAVFVAAQGFAVARRVTATCACFGRSGAPVGAVGLARTGLLLGVSLLGLLAPAGRSGAAAPALAMLAMLAGCAAGLLLVNLEDVVALFKSAPARPTRLGG